MGGEGLVNWLQESQVITPAEQYNSTKPASGLSSHFSDNFSDGNLNNNLWVFGGTKRGWDINNPLDKGNWEYSQTESDHLQLKVNGPSSNYTYGADVWVRTKYNYNDGEAHIINFIWQPEITEHHYNSYYIQITDGYINPTNNLHWIQSPNYLGTVNILWGRDKDNYIKKGWFLDESSIEPLCPVNLPGLEKLSWSIKIQPSGIVSLYDETNASGNLRRYNSLDTTSPWFVRFILCDGNSGGFSNGNAKLNLFYYSSD